jgi:hypothetical protein
MQTINNQMITYDNFRKIFSSNKCLFKKQRIHLSSKLDLLLIYKTLKFLKKSDVL